MGDKWYPRSTTDGYQCRQLRRVNTVATQQVQHGLDDATERLVDYRVEFGTAPAQTMAFFGRYLEVVPNERLVWTNEESEDAAVTTVTFENKGDVTLLTLSELYPSKEALDASFEGMEGGAPEQFAQLDELLVALSAGAGTQTLRNG